MNWLLFLHFRPFSTFPSPPLVINYPLVLAHYDNQLLTKKKLFLVRICLFCSLAHVRNVISLFLRGESSKTSFRWWYFSVLCVLEFIYFLYKYFFVCFVLNFFYRARSWVKLLCKDCRFRFYKISKLPALALIGLMEIFFWWLTKFPKTFWDLGGDFLREIKF